MQTAYAARSCIGTSELEYELCLLYVQSYFSSKVGFKLILDAFAKLRKVTLSFVLSVTLSVCPQGTSQVLVDEFNEI